MKGIVTLVLPALLLALAACDKVTNPIVKKNVVVGTNFVVNTNSSSVNQKKILLEDFTGMKCPNCPRAARTATTLTSQNANLVVVAVHAGGFAQPFGKYTLDLRTNVGDKWNSSEGFSIPSYPNGIINRKRYGANELVVIDTKWSSVIDAAKSDPMRLKLLVTSKYDTTVKSLNVSATATFVTANANDVNLTAIIIEDGIVGKQLDGSVDIEEYDFEHVLRGTLNGDWGQKLNKKPIVAGDTVSMNISSNFDLLNGFNYIIENPAPDPPTIKPIKVNDKKSYVVVIASDAVTREVLQVEKVKIR